MRIINWNIQWARPTSKRGQKIAAIVDGRNADVVCLTEAFEDQFSHGFSITSHEDYGYPIKQGRRKVVLWSANPWSNVDIVGDRQLPSGRFVAGTTETPVGAIRIVGVCIPWSAAHVSSGHRNRQRWEDHIEYLNGLKRLLSGQSDREDVPTIVLGDFNQSIPRTRAPKRAFSALDAAFDSLVVATANVQNDEGKQSIDHLAHSPDLSCNKTEVISQYSDETRLSDHFGLVCEMQ